MSEARFQIFGGVIGGNPTYYPGYQHPSEPRYVPARLVVPVYVNHDQFGAAAQNGREKKSSLFHLTLWGDKASAAGAHWFTPGKTMYFRGRMEGNRIMERDNQGQVLTEIARGGEKGIEEGKTYVAGETKPILRHRYSFVIERFHFGADSLKAEQAKPVGWNVAGTPGHQAWQNHIANMRASQAAGWTGGNQFGNAIVGKVSGTPARRDDNGNVIPIQFGMPGGQFTNPGMQPGQNFTAGPQVGDQFNAGGQQNGQFIQNPNMMNAGAAGTQFTNPAPNAQFTNPAPNMGVPPVPGMQPNVTTAPQMNAGGNFVPPMDASGF